MDAVMGELSTSMKKLKKNKASGESDFNEFSIKSIQYKNDLDALIQSRKKLLAKLEYNYHHEAHYSYDEPDDQGDQKQQFLKWIFESASTKYTKQNVLVRYILNAESVVCCVGFDPSGRFFAFAGARTLNIVNSATGQFLLSCDMTCNQQESESQSRSLAFSYDGSLIAYAITPTLIGLFSLAQKRLIQVLDGHLRAITSVLFVRNSDLLVSGGVDGIICIWDIKAMSIVKKIQHGKLENDSDSSKDGAISSIINIDQIFIVGFLIGTVSVYSWQFNDILYSFQAHEEMLITMSLTCKGELITASSDGVIKIWTITLSGAECRLLIYGHDNYVTSICSSLNESIFITGSKDETIKGWNSDSGDNIFIIKAHTNTVLSLAHHPNGGMFTSSSGDGLVITWTYPGISK